MNIMGENRKRHSNQRVYAALSGQLQEQRGEKRGGSAVRRIEQVVNGLLRETNRWLNT